VGVGSGVSVGTGVGVLVGSGVAVVVGRGGEVAASVIVAAVETLGGGVVRKLQDARERTASISRHETTTDDRRSDGVRRSLYKQYSFH
jgi:hypothetical protein